MRPMRSKQAAALALAAALWLVAAAQAADQIVKDSGEVLTGRVISQDDDNVLFELRRPGGTVQMLVPRAEIRDILRGVPDPADTQPATAPAPGYYVMQVRGILGRDFTLAMLRQLMADARNRNAAVVVLMIDSPGGDVSDAWSLVDELSKMRGVRMAALVRQAVGPAAAVALAATDLYFAPLGVLEGFSPEPADAAADPLARARALAMRRGMFVTAAERGGRAALLAEALAEPDLELGLTEQNGQVKIVAGPGDERLTAVGQSLRLTGETAQRIGLSKGVVAAPAELAEALGIAGLRPLPDANDYVRGQEMARRRIAYENWLAEQRKAGLAELQAAYRNSLEPRLTEIDGQLAALDAEVRNYQVELAAAEAEYDRLIDRARRRYADAVRAALHVQDEWIRARLITNARRWRDDALDDAQDDYEAQAAPLRLAIEQAANDARVLLAERQRLLGNTPAQLPPNWQPPLPYGGPMPE